MRSHLVLFLIVVLFGGLPALWAAGPEAATDAATPPQPSAGAAAADPGGVEPAVSVAPELAMGREIAAIPGPIEAPDRDAGDGFLLDIAGGKAWVLDLLATPRLLVVPLGGTERPREAQLPAGFLTAAAGVDGRVHALFVDGIVTFASWDELFAAASRQGRQAGRRSPTGIELADSPRRYRLKVASDGGCFVRDLHADRIFRLDPAGKAAAAVCGGDFLPLGGKSVLVVTGAAEHGMAVREVVVEPPPAGNPRPQTETRGWDEPLAIDTREVALLSADRQDRSVWLALLPPDRHGSVIANYGTETATSASPGVSRGDRLFQDPADPRTECLVVARLAAKAPLVPVARFPEGAADGKVCVTPDGIYFLALQFGAEDRIDRVRILHAALP